MGKIAWIVGICIIEFATYSARTIPSNVDEASKLPPSISQYTSKIAQSEKAIALLNLEDKGLEQRIKALPVELRERIGRRWLIQRKKVINKIIDLESKPEAYLPAIFNYAYSGKSLIDLVALMDSYNKGFIQVNKNPNNVLLQRIFLGNKSEGPFFTLHCGGCACIKPDLSNTISQYVTSILQTNCDSDYGIVICITYANGKKIWKLKVSKGILESINNLSLEQLKYIKKLYERKSKEIQVFPDRLSRYKDGETYLTLDWSKDICIALGVLFKDIFSRNNRVMNFADKTEIEIHRSLPKKIKYNIEHNYNLPYPSEYKRNLIVFKSLIYLAATYIIYSIWVNNLSPNLL